MNKQATAGGNMRWEVQVFERKRRPDLGSELVEVPRLRKKAPKDTIPKKLTSIAVHARKHDQALRAARIALQKQGRTVASLSFSAEAQHRMVAYVFEKEQRQ